MGRLLRILDSSQKQCVESAGVLHLRESKSELMFMGREDLYLSRVEKYVGVPMGGAGWQLMATASFVLLLNYFL